MIKMKKRNFTFLLIFFTFIVAIIFIRDVIEKITISTSNEKWLMDDVYLKMRDGFRIKAYVVRPEKNGKIKYPAVVCFHQLWGNRDDYIKLMPFLARKRIVTVVPMLVRQRPNFSPKRFTDLRDTINFVKNLSYVDNKRIGIIGASFSVESGMRILIGDRDIKSAVLISGALTDLNSRKWITLNTDLALLFITSIYDSKPTDPAHHHLLFLEAYMRSLNPFTDTFFIKDKSNPYGIYAHGTFVFDEKPEVMTKIASFLSKTLKSHSSTKRVTIKNYPPDNLVEFKSTDGFPVFATFLKGEFKKSGIIIYPPKFHNREYYYEMGHKLNKMGYNVLLPNIKRTCREHRTVYLCKRELNGAYEFVRKRISPRSKVILVLPSFYFLAGKVLIDKNHLKSKYIIFYETGMFNYGINPSKIKKQGYKLKYIHRLSIKKIVRFILKTELSVGSNDKKF